MTDVKKIRMHVIQLSEKLHKIQNKLSDKEYKGFVEELGKFGTELPQLSGGEMDIIAIVELLHYNWPDLPSGQRTSHKGQHTIRTREELKNFLKLTKPLFLHKRYGSIFLLNGAETDSNSVEVTPETKWSTIEKQVNRAVYTKNGSVKPLYRP